MTVTVELIVWIAAAALGLVAVTTALVWPVAARWGGRRARRRTWLSPEARGREWANEIAARRRNAVLSPTMWLPQVPRLGGYRDNQIARDPALGRLTRRPGWVPAGEGDTPGAMPHELEEHSRRRSCQRCGGERTVRVKVTDHLDTSLLWTNCPDCCCPEPDPEKLTGRCGAPTGGGFCPTHQHADDIREEDQAKRRDDR